ENCPAALGLQLLPAADDVPTSDVQHDGLEAEGVVVLRTFPHACPRFPQYPSIKGQHISVFQQLIERNKPRKDAAETEVGLVEVVTDVLEPAAEPDRGRAQSVATTTQRRQDHAHVHPGGKDLSNQRVSDLLH